MLQIGSKLKMKDNAGAKAIRIFHMGKKANCKNTFVTYNNVVKGSIIQDVPNKKLKKKSKVLVLIVGTKKKKSRKTGCYVNMRYNLGVIIQDPKKRKPYATKSKLAVPREVKKDKRNVLIYKIVTKFF